MDPHAGLRRGAGNLESKNRADLANADATDQFRESGPAGSAASRHAQVRIDDHNR
jgi:hypothetical protein